MQGLTANRHPRVSDTKKAFCLHFGLDLTDLTHPCHRIVVSRPSHPLKTAESRPVWYHSATTSSKIQHPATHNCPPNIIHLSSLFVVSLFSSSIFFVCCRSPIPACPEPSIWWNPPAIPAGYRIILSPSTTTHLAAVRCIDPERKFRQCLVDQDKKREKWSDPMVLNAAQEKQLG